MLSDHTNLGNISAAVGAFVGLAVCVFPKLVPLKEPLVPAIVVVVSGALSVWDRVRATRRHKRELAKHRKCE